MFHGALNEVGKDSQHLRNITQYNRNDSHNTAQNLLKRLCLFTEVVYGSGDFYGAQKLILSLLKYNPDIEIQWVIIAPKTRIDTQERKTAATQILENYVTISQHNHRSPHLSNPIDKARYKDINDEIMEVAQILENYVTISQHNHRNPHLSNPIDTAKYKDINDKIMEAAKILGKNVTITLQLLSHTLETSKYKDVDMILFFPTIHYLDTYNFRQLQKLRVPLLQVYEYDGISILHHLPNKSELPCVPSGFGGLGLFLEQIDPQKLSVNALPLVLQSIFSPDKEVFFSYLGPKTSQVINHVDFETFSKIVMKITNTEKSADIITNSDRSIIDNEFTGWAVEHGFSEIYYVKRDKDGQLISDLVYRSPNKNNGRQLRLVNVFPLTNNQMLTLMAHAHPMVQVTGDQSLSEVIALAQLKGGVFPFYQMMEWKLGLYQNWLELAIAQLSKDSAYVKLLKLTQPKKPVDPNEFGKIWQENQDLILSDSQKLSLSLNTEKNLYFNFPRYLEMIVNLKKLVPSQYVHEFSQLLAQLVPKVRHNDAIIKIIEIFVRNADSAEIKNTICALTEFLKLNTVNLDEASIITVIRQLEQVSLKHRIFTAKTARKILNIIPADLHGKWLAKIIPELARIPSGYHTKILEHIEKFENIRAALERPTWLTTIVDDSLLFEGKYKEEFEDRILLAVNVFPDGDGDIAKFTGTYKLLCKAFPNYTINVLIKCINVSTPAVLAMLRENDIPIQDVYFIFQSMLEATVEKYFRMPSLSMVHRDSYSRYKAIISLQTPFDEINGLIRGYAGTIPYLEIAEVNYCSYNDIGVSRLLDSSRDAAHDLVAMGVTPESVGLEITEMPNLEPDQVFSKMTPKLATQLLDGELTQENIKNFLQNTFFMPAYLKDEQGILGIKFALLLTDKTVRDKQNTVVWVNEIAFDVYAPDFQQMLRDKGFSSFVVYGSDGVRKETKIENASGNKKFQIICCRVEKQDFNLLYYLARYTGGVAGCVGQNSFETTVSFDLVPAFYAPPWQRAIIYQCQRLATSLFNQDSEEYHCLNDYLEMLSRISLFIQAKQVILSLRELRPHSKSLQLLEGEDFKNALAYIVNDITSLISRFPDAFQAHPLQQLETFLQTHDMNLLMAAWKQVCVHIKENKNYNRWLVDQVGQYLAAYPKTNLQKVIKKSTSSLEDVMSKLEIYHHVALDNLPKTAKLIRKMVTTVWPGFTRHPTQLILTSSDAYYIDYIRGVSPPTIAISAACLQLNSGELRFAMRLIAETFKNNPIENINTYYREPSVSEFMDCIKEDLEFGISYCRKLIDLLIYKIKQNESKQIEDDKLSGKIEFYTDMIRVIELNLAEKNQTAINQNNDYGYEMVDYSNWLPAPEFNEIAITCIEWQQNTQSLPQLDSSTLLDELIHSLPSLRIKDKKEYEHATIETKHFLRKLESLIVNHDDLVLREKLESLIDLALENKVACFSELYIIILRKLMNTPDDRSVRFIQPLGIFKKLQKILLAFCDAKTLEDALESAQSINSFLTDKSNSALFVRKESISTLTMSKNPADEVIWSYIGRLIPWESYISRYKKNQHWSDKNKFWVSLDETGLIAIVLVRFGILDETVLWRNLSPQFVSNLYIYTPEIILGNISRKYSYSNYTDKRPTIAFLWDYYEHRHKKKRILPSFYFISKADIERFIAKNREALALTEVTMAAYELIEMFEMLLSINPVEGQLLVKQFYVDPHYSFGLYSLFKLREEILLDDLERFNFRIIKTEEGKIGTNANQLMDHPYIRFILNDKPTFIPLEELAFSFYNNFCTSVFDKWPLSYFLEVLNFKLDCMADIREGVHKLVKYQDMFKGHYKGKCGEHLFSTAVYNVFNESAVKLPNIILFSEETYQYVQLREKFNNDFIDTFYHKLWERKPGFTEELYQEPVAVNICVSKVAFFYQLFDSRMIFPNSAIRDRFSQIMLAELAKADDDEQLKALEILLFNSTPLTDLTLAKKLIEKWVALSAAKLIKELKEVDENQYHHYFKITRLITGIIEETPRIYHRDMCEGLAVAIEAQSKISEFIKHQFEASGSTPKIINDYKYSVLFYSAHRLAEKNLTFETVRFLSYELTRSSLDRFHNALENAKFELVKHRKNQEIFELMLYHQFWNCTLKERAVLINNLLIPNAKLITPQLATEAYSSAFKFVTEQLFLDTTEENEICKALLESFLNAADESVRPYQLAAVIIANRMIEGQRKNVAFILAKLAEALGAAGVKAGQAAHSNPSTPLEYREALAHLKSRSRIPYRDELWELIEKSVPLEVLNQIGKVKKILGGASFYVAVEVKMKNGETAVLRLLRKDAKQEAQDGFARLNATIARCKDPRIAKIKDDLSQIIQEAEVSAQMEINSESVQKQYEIAQKIYGGQRHTVVIDNKTYHIRIKPVDLFASGPGFQLISKADGIEFNDLKRDANNLPLCQAVALGVCKTALPNMIGKGKFDADRHGGQTCVDSKERESEPGVYDVDVTFYDFGEIATEETTPAQYAHCEKFMQSVMQELFSIGNLKKWVSSSSVTTSLLDELATKLMTYIRENSGGENAEQKKHDLSRLRQIFKGLLALNDYFEVLLGKKELLDQLKDIVTGNVTSQMATMVVNNLKDNVKSGLASLFSGPSRFFANPPSPASSKPTTATAVTSYVAPARTDQFRRQLRG